MRGIQFRGKSVDTGKWTHGYLIGDNVIVGNIVEFNDEYFNTSFWQKVRPETVVQYTGLKDKNGKEIYEGDILDHRTYVYSDIGRQGIVCYDSNQCKYKLVPHGVYDINAGNVGFSGYAFDYHIASDSEIIGNIYEKAVKE